MIPPYYEEKTITFTAEEISLIREEFFKKLLNFDIVYFNYNSKRTYINNKGECSTTLTPIDPSLYRKKKCIEDIIRKLDE